MNEIITRSVLENFLVGLFILAIEILIISRIIKLYTKRREKKMWTPFRSIFYRSVHDFHEGLLKIFYDWRDNAKTRLKIIQSEQKLTKENLYNLTKIYEDALKDIEVEKGIFFNFIQTVSPSLRPESAKIIEKPLDFYERFYQRISRRLAKLKSISDDSIPNNIFSEELLRKTQSDIMVFEILVDFGFNRYSNMIRERAKKEEKLYYYEGEFLTFKDFKFETDGDNSNIQYSIDSSKIKRTLPISNFFNEENKI
jgi:hypothetical protein